MGLPHYKNSKASTAKYEPVFLNQFELILTPPAGIDPGVGNNGQNLMMEHVKKVSGLELDKNPGVIDQHYKFAKRRYAGSKPETTTFDMVVDFEVNLNDANSMYIFKTLRQWNDIIYNPMTGAMGLKKDYSGSGTLTIFNKAGDIFRKIRIPVLFPMTAINAMELDYQSTEIYTISMTFACENPEDLFN
jgi:hypothetical protein